MGGQFTNVNNNGTALPAANWAAKWDGTNWSALGSNGAGGSALNNTVHVFFVNGTDVYAGGSFTNVNNNGTLLGAADYLAKWNGSGWSALGSNGSGDGAITNKGGAFIKSIAMQSGNLLAGGGFYDLNNSGTVLPQADFLAKWDGANWAHLATDANGALVNGYASSKVSAILVNGTDVYVGGQFENVSNHGLNLTAADYIAKWDGANWSALGSNGAGEGSLLGVVQAFAMIGTDLYVGGLFTNVNNNGTALPAADYIAKWDGTNWSALSSNGAGNGSLPNSGFVNALAVSGTDLYVGGSFTNVNNNGGLLLDADYIAKWDGTNWSALGNNGVGDGALNAYVSALAVSGLNLYAGGNFTNVANNAQADYVAKWNGSAWSALGSDGAGNGSLNGPVFALAVNGTDLYAGGQFNNVNNNGTILGAADLIAKWDGTNWSALGSNGTDGLFCLACAERVNDIVFAGGKVYIGGGFTNIRSNNTILTAADHVACWDGANWSALGSNGAGDGSIKSNNGVYALEVQGADLLVGGLFSDVNNNGTVMKEADYLAAYGIGADVTPPMVASITRAGANPTVAASVDLTVSFTESVTGVDAGDFVVIMSGVTGAVVSGVAGSGSLYTLTVNTGTGNGTIRLDVADNNSIVDLSANPLGGVAVGDGNFTGGETYSINKGGDTTGVFRPGNGLLYLKNTNTSGFADVAINYGLGGDYPVAGDWDGNGTATIGIYRNGSFYLRNSNTLGFADLVVPFGTPGDQPVVGDWNGDGVDTIGVYSNGQFLLRNTNTAGIADMSFYLGNPGDVGIAGDWNGDGSDTTGVFRPSNGVIFLKNLNTTGFADININYGLSGDMPVIGDWNNDGIDTIGVYRNAQFLLRNSNTIGFADIVFALGNPGDMPIAGNWDGIP